MMEGGSLRSVRGWSVDVLHYLAFCCLATELAILELIM